MWDELEISLARVTQRIKETDDAAKGLSTTVSDLATKNPEITGLEDAVKRLKTQLDDAKKLAKDDPDLINAKNYYQDIENSIKNLKDLQKNDPAIVALNAQLGDLKEKREQLQRASEDSDALKAKSLQLRDVRESVLEIERKIAYYQTPEARLANPTLYLPNEITNLQRQKKQLEDTIPGLEKQIDAMRKQEEPFRISAERRAIEEEKLKAREDEIRAQVEAAQQKYADQIAALQKKYDDARDRYDLMRDEEQKKLDDIQRQYDDAKKKLDDLNSSQDATGTTGDAASPGKKGGAGGILKFFHDVGVASGDAKDKTTQDAHAVYMAVEEHTGRAITNFKVAVKVSRDTRAQVDQDTKDMGNMVGERFNSASKRMSDFADTVKKSIQTFMDSSVYAPYLQQYLDLSKQLLSAQSHFDFSKVAEIQRLMDFDKDFIIKFGGVGGDKINFDVILDLIRRGLIDPSTFSNPDKTLGKNTAGSSSGKAGATGTSVTQPSSLSTAVTKGVV
jgi:myosin heavy subunit